ncbi:MAG: bifunctional 4-hydroxy-3-methylbut-2-enyl diphosphate reductase/30S ribosomal protein S1 [Clostridiales bacterium]|nr:bifunctional 4-hydroxy-3-methylbut-2-enyl diphosphate reductase/30S ribosomal protein S1 [Clostridiales bacterium]
MQIRVAKTAGFCFGVNRAVKLAYEMVEKGEKGCTLGPLIHNSDVTDDLEKKGLRIIDLPEKAEKDETVLIRAHGVPPEIYDTMDSMGVKYIDATCPFVKKIHSIVQRESTQGAAVLIAGDRNHPEVIGITGYCLGECFTFGNLEELKNLTDSNSSLRTKRVAVVSQTTFSREVWEECKNFFKKIYTNAKIFDTICGATRERQAEAKEIAAASDAMIVIGARHSSNTVKLKDVCSGLCDTFLVERASELKKIDFSTYANVGVTAGASTPDVIIKEVLSAMSEVMNETTNIQVEEVPSAAELESMDALLSEELSEDAVVKCTVMAITGTEIKVALPSNHVLGGLTGLVSYEEYSSDPNADPSKELKIGDEISLVIMKKNDAEGTVNLSKRRFDSQQSWSDIVAASEDGSVLEGVVISVIKGGILVVSNGSRVFIPASLATERRDDNLEDLVKQNIRFKVIEVNTARRRAVGSVRAVIREEKKAAAEAFWASAEVGKEYTGVVKSMTSYGAFVDIGGIDGMVHISEMSWKRIKNPSEIFSIGQEVVVYIKALDPENKKISLGYRRDEDNPWFILKRDYPEGSVVEAEIVSLTTFGAFARVIPGIDGLIHISQIANHRVEKPEDELAVGQKVMCKIIGIDFDKKRVSLSIRALIEPEQEETADEESVEETAVEETAAEETAVETDAE